MAGPISIPCSAVTAGRTETSNASCQVAVITSNICGSSQVAAARQQGRGDRLQTCFTTASRLAVSAASRVAGACR
jgi:hypothetical protein